MTTRRDLILRELGLVQWRLRSAVAAHPPIPLSPVSGQAPAAGDPPSAVSGPESVTAAGERIGATAAMDWRQLEAAVQACTACALHARRRQSVFGVGDEQADWLLIGEGPGAEEDERGEPFVGQAGRLLDNMLASIGLRRGQDVYIANVVKCRPPGNRTPTEPEMTSCAPFLFRQLAILRPKVIVTLGAPAAHTLLATTTPIGRLRGQFYDFPPPPLASLGLPGCRLMPTFHPAYLLRAPQEKAKTWDDLKQVMGALDLRLPTAGAE